MTGMENLMRSMLKAMGFNPEELQQGVHGFMTDVFNRLNQYGDRMTRLETLLASIDKKLDELLGVNHGQPKSNGRLISVDDAPVIEHSSGSENDHDGTGPIA